MEREGDTLNSSCHQLHSLSDGLHSFTHRYSQLSHDQQWATSRTRTSASKTSAPLRRENSLLDRLYVPLWTQQLPWAELSPLNLACLVCC